MISGKSFEMYSLVVSHMMMGLENNVGIVEQNEAGLKVGMFLLLFSTGGLPDVAKPISIEPSDNRHPRLRELSKEVYAPNSSAR